MKNIFLTIGMLLYVFGASAQIHLMIFIDKSASVSFIDNGKLMPKCVSGLQQNIDLLKDGNDQLSAYFIHSGVGETSMIVNEVIPTCKIGHSKIETKAIKDKYMKNCKDFKIRLYNSLSANLQLLPNKKTSGRSPILKTLSIASAQAQPGSRIRLVYFSDMVEFSKIRKGLNPKSKQEAIALAQKDIKRMSVEYEVNASALKGASADIYLPVGNLGASLGENVPDYWREIFRNYGMSVSFH